MKNQIISLVIFLYLVLVTSFYAQYVIKGKVVGYDGKPMLKANIQQLTNVFPYNKIVKVFPVNQEGSFLINYPKPGYFRLRFCGLYHKPNSFKEFGIYLDEKDTVELNIQLQLYTLKTKIDKITFWTRREPQDKYLMKKTEANINDDSTYSVEVKADSEFVTYCVSGLTEEEMSRNLLGDKSDFYELGRYGDYYSIIKTKKDSTVTLTVDLKKLMNNTAKEKLEFIKAPDHTKKFLIVNDDYNKRYLKYHIAMQEDRKNKSNQYDYTVNDEYDWKKDLDELEQKIKTEKDDFLRKAWMVSRYRIVMADSWAKQKDNISKELAMMSLSEIEPDSPIWSFHCFGIADAIRTLTKRPKTIQDASYIQLDSKEVFQPYINYLVKAVEDHPDSTIRERLIIQTFSSAHIWGFEREFEKYWKIYLREYPNSHFRDSNEKRFSKDSNIQIGKQIPDFSFTSINSQTVKVSKTSMLGKKYLINFWAAWCGPCRGDLEALRNFKNKYGGSSFSIISVSLCFKKEDIFDFQENYPMPWFNTHVDMKNDINNVLKNFEVQTIPKDILVDERGYIITINDLEKIMEILSRK